MDTFQYLIIGAGFAGAATAYQLARRGARDIIILEQEEIAGFHSSGRNAAMIRQCVPDPALSELTRDSAAFLRDLPSDWPETVQFKQNGSLLLGSGAGWQKLQHDAEIGRNLGVDVELWSPEEAQQYVSVLQDARFDGAVWCATDGVVDIHALLSGYLKFAVSRGAQVRYGAAVSAIRHEGRDGFAVEINGGAIRARTMINAAGAWANTVARLAGVGELPMRP